MQFIINNQFKSFTGSVCLQRQNSRSGTAPIKYTGLHNLHVQAWPTVDKIFVIFMFLA